MAELAQPERPLKLDLACGTKVEDGWTGVDKWAKGDRITTLDLITFPWPWDDNSVDELRCSHFIEHIPMSETMDGRDLLCAFFDEAYRVAKPGANFRVIWPALQSVRAFMDPTHRRFIPAEFTLYLSKEWRSANGLEHYLGRCNWVGGVVPTMAQEEGLRAQEVQARRYREAWNVSQDFVADLKAIKG